MNAETMARAARWLANGYPPVPVLRPDAPKSVHQRQGRQADARQAAARRLWHGKEKAIYGATPASIAGWSRLHGIDDYPGLGIACGQRRLALTSTCTSPISPSGSRRWRSSAWGHGLRRVGQGPKVRWSTERRRTAHQGQTDVFVKGELKAKVEVWARASSSSVRHPSDRGTYKWPDASPETLPAAELPTVTQEQVEALRRAAEALLRAAGYRTKAEIEAEQRAGARPTCRGEGGQERRQPVPRGQRGRVAGTRPLGARAVRGGRLQGRARRVAGAVNGPRPGPRGGHQHLAERYRRLRRARHGRPRPASAPRSTW